jgi:hypothetical protein
VDGGLHPVPSRIRPEQKCPTNTSDAAHTRNSKLRWRSNIPQLLASLCWSPLFCQTLIAKPTWKGSPDASRWRPPLLVRVATMWRIQPALNTG